MSTVKLCVDCKHYIDTSPANSRALDVELQCVHPELALPVDVVTGRAEIVLCRTQRDLLVYATDAAMPRCGYAGSMWENKS